MQVFLGHLLVEESEANINVGNPKPITYTHYMMAGVDIAASVPGEEESFLHQFANARWFTPLPSMHVRLQKPSMHVVCSHKG
jgi:hypothetical protein